MSFDSRCSICSRPAVRDAVAAALAAGSTPAEVFAHAGDEFGISRAGLYRHVRHSERGALGGRYLDGESTTGDLVADTNSIRTALAEAFRDAMHRGATREAATLAREHSAAVAALDRLGVSVDAAAAIKETDHIIDALRRATQGRPDFARELASAFEALGDDTRADGMRAGADLIEKEKNK